MAQNTSARAKQRARRPGSAPTGKRASGSKPAQSARRRAAAVPAAKEGPARRARPRSVPRGGGKAAAARASGSPTAPARRRSPSRNGPAGGIARAAKGLSGGASAPLLAGTAAVAGVVGGMALGGAKAGERVLGVRVPGRRRVQIRSRDLASAAKDIGRFSEQLGAVAGGLRRTHEALDGNGHVRRSPVEVVLQALTARS